MRITYGGGGSRPSDKGGGEGRGGGCHLDPEITGGPVSNFFVGPLASVLSKNKGGPPSPSPGSVTDLTYS